MFDYEARERIQALEAQGVQRDRAIARLSGRLLHLAATLEAIHAESPASASGRPLDSPAVPPHAPADALKADAFDELRVEIWGLKAWRAGFTSLIVAGCPVLFGEFRGKRFTLLWRGSRDGFGAGDFHGRCDDHANTLTLIEDTARNIFGGFTPVKWDSKGGYKADRSLKSFLFSLKNPHNFPARKFALKAEKRDEAIYCNSAYGPHFHDIGVSDNCNTKTDSYTHNFGRAYANGTGLDGKTFFTGSNGFIVKEIEVFDITD
jgi:hypothetical protein